MDIRRTVTNNTGQSVTRLRWRIVDISTYTAAPPAGIAERRALSSGPVNVTVDRAPCGSGADSEAAGEFTPEFTTAPDYCLPTTR